ncbi:MAG: sulfur carrier protein ThiS [Chloroflexi bacterium]|nr:sulfur carrier protein ThiS [Chloroflexota bacterium]MCH8816303.1 sulfur carrier protein ThiS [Chloroflexota bacterium]
MITVVINGSDTELDGPTSLVAYLESKDLAERRVAVAINGEIVPRPEYDSIIIREGDRLEIVRPAGGG